MAVFVRALLIWLLVLAIPAQGAAAAIMVPCGPNHHTGGAAQSAFSATASLHAHHGAALHAQAFDLRGAAVMIADDATATAKPGPGARQTCSACASCCSSNAMLTWVPVVSSNDSAPAVFDTVVLTVDAFAADGPDRPPRNSFV